MSGIRILCDTNILLYLLSNNELVVDFLMGKQVYISAITELELFGKQNMTDEEVSNQLQPRLNIPSSHLTPA